MKIRALIVLLAVMSAGAQADVLLMESITAAPPNTESGVLRPRTGNSMAQVLTDFGDPKSVKDAIGEPPISRWIYPGYTVYFEHQHVIHVVVHR